MTEILTLRGGEGDTAAIERAAALIRAGRLVAFPTETVYGLGADALSKTAVARIYEAKGRDHDDPCIVHIADPAEIGRVAAIESMRQAALVAALSTAFWPGPLSLIVPRGPAIPPIVDVRPVHGGRAHALAPRGVGADRAAGVPIAAPSANTFMHTSPTSAQHVWETWQGGSI